MELHQIIRRPLVTEKTTLLREGNQYIFEVDPRANKIEIEKAVEKLANQDTGSKPTASRMALIAPNCRWNMPFQISAVM